MKTLPPELESKLVLDTDDPRLPSIAELQAQDRVKLEAYKSNWTPNTRREQAGKWVELNGKLHDRLFLGTLVGGVLAAITIASVLAATLGLPTETMGKNTVLLGASLSLLGLAFLIGGFAIAGFLAFWPKSPISVPEEVLKLMWLSRLEKLREWAKATYGDYITLSETEALLYKLARKA